MDLIPAQPLGPDDDDDSTIHTALTPPSTSASIHLALHPTAQPHFSPTPHPGATVLIKAVLSNQVITLRGGRIILSPPDGSASLWECVESNGWLGFRSAVSGAFLGRNWNLDLCCSAGWHLASVDSVGAK
ncbi:hypothetical protein UCDDS831_g08244 [Diplodia seriata]|uniref:Uncharacterized protein n=1 Tax=Diplodia seriata TaxID=420778 RepID=A0A0G2FR23_9PEZI|nr:hypothetical protein UCDDS831_g08244 [Diplodia seriata]